MAHAASASAVSGLIKLEPICIFQASEFCPGVELSIDALPVPLMQRRAACTTRAGSRAWLRGCRPAGLPVTRSWTTCKTRTTRRCSSRTATSYMSTSSASRSAGPSPSTIYLASLRQARAALLPVTACSAAACLQHPISRVVVLLDRTCTWTILNAFWIASGEDTDRCRGI